MNHVRRSRDRVRLGVVALSLCLCACGVGVRYAPPAVAHHDARFGWLAGHGAPPTHEALCSEWSGAIGARDYYANSHISYPESDPGRACYTRVRHGDEKVTVDEAPSGCAFPQSPAREALNTLAARLEKPTTAERSPLFPCSLPTADLAAARKHDGKTLRALAAAESLTPYAAIIVPGFGTAVQGETPLVDWRPGDACRETKPADDLKLQLLITRSRRGAKALAARVANVITVTGGAVHSPLNEAFAMLHILQCRLDVKPEQVLVEPCAEHTHENLRNTGRWLVAMGARVGYLVTDDGLQADYFQDFSGFELVLGSIDQRCRRDFGYLLGSWRQASVGIDAGFWYTPYRFWAEPRDGLGGLTCLDR